MAYEKTDWEKDLLQPIVSDVPDERWMEGVERRLMQMRNNWHRPVALIVGIMGLMIFGVVFYWNQGALQSSVKSNAHAKQIVEADHDKKLVFLETWVTPYQDINSLMIKAKFSNKEYSQTVEVRMTRNSTDEPNFSIVTPGTSEIPAPALTTAAETYISPMTVFAWLAADFSLWSLIEDEEYNGREAYVVQGRLPADEAKKFNAATFELWVDKDSGVVMQKKLFANNGDPIETLRVYSLRVERVNGEPDK